MQLKDIMSRNVESISADASLVEAANKMLRLDIGFLPVLNGNAIVGVVTDRDIVTRSVAKGHSPSDTKVSEVTTPEIEILPEEEDVRAAAQLMQDKQIRRVLVKDDRDAYVGVVSLGDLAANGHEIELSGQALERVCAV